MLDLFVSFVSCSEISLSILHTHTLTGLITQNCLSDFIQCSVRRCSLEGRYRFGVSTTVDALI